MSGGTPPRDPAAYGDAWADVYDDEHARLADADDAAAVLAELAAGGRVLEFGVGTGRVALPLAARGIDVHGIDASARMLDRLRTKEGASRVSTHLGDMTTIRLDGKFAVVVLAFNTLFNLLTQDDQVACVHNAAAHLGSGGRLVVEAFVPDLARFHDDQAVRADRIEPNRARVTIERHDPLAQTVDSLHLRIDDQGTRFLPVSIRYAWGSELDLMARLAGLALEHRWGGWDRSPFTAASGTHVSVYRKS